MALNYIIFQLLRGDKPLHYPDYAAILRNSINNFIFYRKQIFNQVKRDDDGIASRTRWGKFNASSIQFRSKESGKVLKLNANKKQRKVFDQLAINKFVDKLFNWQQNQSHKKGKIVAQQKSCPINCIPHFSDFLIRDSFVRSNKLGQLIQGCGWRILNKILNLRKILNSRKPFSALILLETS